MEIRKLGHLSGNPVLEWGLSGYTTEKIYVVSAIGAGNTFEFSVREKKQHYTKIRNFSDEDFERLNSIINKGYSFGAFHDDELIAWAVCDFRKWNNSFCIKDILVHESFRGQNIGRMLIKAINREARDLQCRMVEAETQNTNYHAIKFFQKAGFIITGINTKLYNDSVETAIFMSYDLMM
ncbi:GNAT family N-acetyltransferase [Chryseobacterium salviniae]|uniref:GNAT family N-acetyltransferase n=1 Tax=Chryseobacterium salviniae TaxID=3101750 RepID=A0ABU6HPK8_9FLAO|nr:GNAT family N-acetyltransferase [Chryseobacterium sp. T9W2-O]MEC3874833.1 GNAT family N-acetyltransferase [Chryseobacterium sp. T9W2-O]